MALFGFSKFSTVAANKGLKINVVHLLDEYNHPFLLADIHTFYLRPVPLCSTAMRGRSFFPALAAALVSASI